MNDELFFQNQNNEESALFILALVAEEFRIAEVLQEEAKKTEILHKKRRTSALSRHGSAWTYQDNQLLLRAYERWQNADQDEEIQKWKQDASLTDRSFPYYVFQKYFSSSRTLVGVRKHFFKLKQRHVTNESTMKITIPKNIWMQIDAEEEQEKEAEKQEDNRLDKEERTFLKISTNSGKRRREMSLTGERKHSKEIEFRKIVENAQNAVWN